MMQIQNVARPWGRLQLLQNGGGIMDLYEESFSIGRGETNNWNITTEHTTQKKFDRLSKHQCVISKDCSSNENPVFIKDLSTNGTYVNRELIDRKRILKTGDVISFNHQSFEFFQFINCHEENHGVPKDIFKKYHIGKLLGAGGQGAVRIITDRKTCEESALKIVTRKKRRWLFASEDKQMREVKIMKGLEQEKHKNIVKYYNSQKDKHHIYIFLEYMKGGDLLNRICRNKHLPVDTAKHFFLQLCHAVKLMHDNGNMHRDIKPENILLQSKNELADLKLSDFGLSRKVSNELYTICGTPAYMAPEIRNKSGEYSYKADVWSSGVVLYVMLFGRLPFKTTADETTKDRILTGKFDLELPDILNVPDNAKDLIRKMLTVNVEQRPTIKEVLDHSWLKASDSDIGNELNKMTNLEIGHTPRHTTRTPPSKRRRMD